MDKHQMPYFLHLYFSIFYSSQVNLMIIQLKMKKAKPKTYQSDLDMKMEYKTYTTKSWLSLSNSNNQWIWCLSTSTSKVDTWPQYPSETIHSFIHSFHAMIRVTLLQLATSFNFIFMNVSYMPEQRNEIWPTCLTKTRPLTLRIIKC